MNIAIEHQGKLPASVRPFVQVEANLLFKIE